jgi:hypothetical protein
MSYEDEIITHYHSLSPYTYGFLESVSVRRAIQGSGPLERQLNVELSLVMTPLDHVDGKLRVVFQGVKNLHLRDLNGIERFAIEIRSLAGHQLEDLRFGVEEAECRALSFECYDVRAETIRETA